MKTERGFIVAMHNRTRKIVVISLEMWDLIENRNDYEPLYRADDRNDADNYVKEISSNIQNDSNMVNKQEFIDRVIKWVKNRDNVEKYLHQQTSLIDNFADALRKYLEE